MGKYKRILVWTLSIMMAMGLLLPSTIHAESNVINITNADELAEAIKNQQEDQEGNIQSNTTIELAGDIQLSEELYLKDVNNITIKGNGHTITASDDFKMNTEGQIQLVKVENAKNIVFDNVVLKATPSTKHVLDVYQAEVAIQDVTLDHENAQSGAPLIVNGGQVTLKGKVEFVTGEKSWYAANVDSKNGEAILTKDSEAQVLFSGDANKSLIKVDQNNGNNAEVKGLDKLQEGLYGYCAATIGDVQYHSVQAAVNNAKNGDTVVVKAGRHDEEVKITDKAIHLYGEEGAELFNVVAINTTDEELEGLSIENIHFYGASNTITADVNPSTIYIQGKYKDVVIKNNEMILEERRVDSSHPSDYSIAITTSGGMNGFTVENNTIKNYTMSAYHNPDWSDSKKQVSNDIVYNGNSFENILSGVYFGGVKDAVVVNNSFIKSNGVRIDYGTSVSQIENNKFISRPDDTSFGSYAIRFYEDGLAGSVDLSDNYWGTKDIDSVIDNQGEYKYQLETYYVSEELTDKNIDTNIFDLDSVSVELQEGAKLTIKVTAKDYDGNPVDVKWLSADEKIAKVEDGVITAISSGKTTITVDANGKVRKIEVTVTKKVIEQKPDVEKPKPEDNNTKNPTVTVEPKPDTQKPTQSTTTDQTVETNDMHNVTLYMSLCALTLVGVGIVTLMKKREQLLNK